MKREKFSGFEFMDSLRTGLLPPTSTDPPRSTLVYGDGFLRHSNHFPPPGGVVIGPQGREDENDSFWEFWREYKARIIARSKFSLLVAAFCCAGILSGAVSVALSYALPNADNFVNQNPNLFTTPLAFFFVPACALFIVFSIRTIFIGTGGSGIPAAMLLLDREDSLSLLPKVLSFRILIGKFALLYLGIMGGGSMGKEGPMVILSASTAVLTLELFLKFSGKRRSQITNNLLKYARVMIVAGAGAGEDCRSGAAELDGDGPVRVFVRVRLLRPALLFVQIVVPSCRSSNYIGVHKSRQILFSTNHKTKVYYGCRRFLNS